MSTAAVVAQPDTQQQAAPQQPESLGWRAGLPDDLKQNADLSTYKTVGDFTKDALGWKTKATTLEAEKANYIPKLPENPSADDLSAYYDALGRPKQASEYEFDGEDKNASEWTSAWKQEFHSLGLTKAQAKQLSGKWNAQMNAMVKAHNDAVAAESAAAEKTLRSEMGDKYETNVELAKRMWLKHGDSEFDKAFADAPQHVRLATTKLLVKLAALTGEDVSPTGGIGERKAAGTSGFEYPNSPQMKDMGLRR